MRGSDKPSRRHLRRPATVCRVSRTQGSPPQTPGVLLTHLVFLDSSVSIAKLSEFCVRPGKDAGPYPYRLPDPDYPLNGSRVKFRRSPLEWTPPPRRPRPSSTLVPASE